MHAVWPRTPATRLRLSSAEGAATAPPHLVSVLGDCAGLTGAPSLDVVHVTLPGGDDLVRLASRTGARLGPVALGGRAVRGGATDPDGLADLGIVCVGAAMTASEVRAAVRLAQQLACRRVLFVLPAARASADTAKALSQTSRLLAPFAGVDSGSFGPWSRQPDFVTLNFEASPEDGVAMAA